MRYRRLALGAGLAGAAIIGGVATSAVRGDTAVPTATPPPVSTSTIVRTDLAATILTGGTLGYAPTQPLVNHVAGTYTQLPPVGATIAAGQVLYRVDDQPVVLMNGSIPAWRAFAPGMTAGPDVSELQANLIALGDGRGLLSAPNGHMDAATVGAVDRWQAAEGLPASGTIQLGQVQFLPSTALVGAAEVSLGQSASPGDIPFQVTTTARTVTVPLTPNLPSVSLAERVSIVLPTGAATPGRVTAVEPVPPGAASSSAAPSSSASGQPSSAQASTEAVVTPDDPGATGPSSGVAVEVSLTIVATANVLAVPVSALLALAGGGYGVEVVEPTGNHHLVGVSTGIFAGGLVQITGLGIAPGVRVVVAQ